MPRPRFQLLRTFFRCAFHVATALSTLLLVACLFGWVRSYDRVDNVTYESPALHGGLTSGPGRVLLHAQSFALDQPGLSHDSKAVRPKDKAAWSYLEGWQSRTETGVSLHAHEYRIGGLYLKRTRSVAKLPSWAWFLIIPYAYLTLLTALLPALWLRRFLRRRRAARRARPGFPIEPPSPSEPRPSGRGSADSPPAAR